MDVTLRIIGKADDKQIAALEERLKSLGPALDRSLKPETFEKVKRAADQAAGGVKRVGDETATVGEKVKTAGGLFDGWLGKLAKVGLAVGGVTAIAGGISAAAAPLTDAIGLASDLAESQSKVNVVFGDSAAEVSRFADNAVRAFGLTKGEALSAVGTYGNLLTAMRLPKEAAADMSTELVGLAADLASFNNMATTDVLDKLRAGLVGEAEPLKALGVNMNQARLEGKALELGLLSQGQAFKDLPVDMQAAAKAQAGYAIIMEDTKTAQGDFARTSDGLANSQRILSAAIDNAKAALGAGLLPIITPVVSKAAELAEVVGKVLGPAMELFSAQLSGGPAENAGAIFTMMRDTLGPVGDALFNAATAAGQFGSALGMFVGGDAGGGFERLGQGVSNALDALGALTGLDLSGVQEFLFGAEDSDAGGAWDSISAGLQKLLDVGGQVTTWLTEHKALLGAVVIALGAFSIISTVVGWIGGLMAAWAAAGAGVTAAGGVLTFIVGLLGGPVTIAIAAVAALVAVFALAWKNNWGDIQGKTAAVVDWLKSNLLPPIKAIFGGIQALLSSLVGWWKQNGDQVMAVVSGIVGFVTQQFGFLFDILSGIMKAIVALITGDWAGLGAALGQILAGIVNLVVSQFRGMLSLLGNIMGLLKNVLVGAAQRAIDALVSFLKGGADRAAKFTIDGLVDGLKSGVGRVVDAVVGLARGLIDSFMANLKIGSPSKVFEELGAWITIGLASGIQKEDRKAIEALSQVVAGMNSVITGVQDFASKLLKFVVPSEAQLREAEGRFVQMLVIVQSFTKKFSILGGILGAPNISFVQGQQRANMTAQLEQLKAMFPDIAELAGMKLEDLLTGGEASWATGLMDIVGKVASGWASLADALAKMSSAKMPDASALATLQAAAIRVIMWAQEVTKQAVPNPVGMQDFADTVTAAVNMLSTVAKLDLGKVTDLAADSLGRAAANANRIAAAVVPLALAFFVAAGGPNPADQAANRENLRGAITLYADAVRGSVSVLEAGATDKLATVTALDATALRAASGNVVLILTEVIASAQAFWRAAGGPNAADQTANRDNLLAAVRLYADTVKAAADVLNAGAGLDIAAAVAVDAKALAIAEANASTLEKSVRALAASFMADDPEAQTALADGVKRYADVVRAAADTLAASGALDLAEAVAVDAGLLSIAEGNAVQLFDAIERLTEGFRTRAAEAQSALADATKLYADTVKAAADALGVGAAAKFADVLYIDQAQLNRAAENADLLAYVMEQLIAAFEGAGGDIAGLPALSETAKRYSDTVKAAADALGAGVSAGKIADVVHADQLALSRAAANADLLVYIMAQLVDAWTVKGEGDQKALSEAAKRYADLVGSAATMFTTVATSVSKLAEVQSVGDLTAKLGTVRQWIGILWTELEAIAKDITADEATARATIATAVGTAAKGMADIAESIGKVLELASGGLFGKLLGPDAGRGGLGFMERVRGRRADYAASVLTDTLKRIMSALTTALAQINLPAADDPKLLALDALAGAFGRLADAINELGSAKLPDAARIAAMVAELNSAFAGGPGGGVGGGGGGGSTPFGSGQGGAITATMYMTLSQPVLLDTEVIGRAVERTIIQRGIQINLAGSGA